jgi:transposase
MQRVEVITRGERRRRWSPEEKQAIVAESLAPGASATAVARKYGIGTGLLCKWRHAVSGHGAAEAVHLAAVDVAGGVPRVEGRVAVLSSRPSGLIEIMLPGAVCVRVDATVDERTLHRVLCALRR